MNIQQHRRRLLPTVLAAVTAAILLVTAPGAANADELDPQPVGGGATVPLEITGFDAAVARTNGYELRYDDAGTAWIVAQSARAGDFTDGVALPASVAGNGPAPGTGPEVTPFNTATGSCGTSWIYFTSSTRYRTGFNVNVGNIAYRNWVVTKSSSTSGSVTDNFSAFMNASSWQEYRDFGLSGSSRRVEVTTGTVTTFLGAVCSTIGPWDIW
ncbi:hypothetical protein QT381_15465 [Galbitalea sp. SE-J8]|uniref:hypothetical protein n=1 Tax=Galbitalea sp. SE-J8 TaxID=3054952 RepID=UPI00259CCDB2|nr:hypothetical protein [Galbitalea sp. SE-J8]MDM4764398.1 hypothetical protein [Galbitalea sp. SE-J8]